MLLESISSYACKELKSSALEILPRLGVPYVSSIEDKKSFHPLTYLSYSDLIKNSLLGGQNPSPLYDLFISTLRLNTPDLFDVLLWNDQNFTPKEWQLLLKSMGTEPIFPVDLDRPGKNSYRHTTDSVLKDLEKFSPPYYRLLRTTLNTLILAEPGKDSNRLRLSFGGSTYMFFWGGAIINSRLLSSYSLFFEQLIHESCHMALFMLCSKYGLLCTNPDTELYNSAFRKDSGRPMHGIIHAYFVAKNLSECFKNFPAISHKNYKSAESLHEVISSHANLTKFGKLVFENPEVEELERLVESNLGI
jgi:hypothetical protein